MARIVTNIDDFETWVSAIEGIIFIRKFDRRGDLTEEMVKGHGKLVITPEERRFNQERVAQADLDPFLNGMLVPVKLVESADDYETLKGNPNHLTEQDMRAMLATPKEIASLEADLAKITNPTTLQRLLSLAQDDEIDATIRQVKTIKERIAQVIEEPVYHEVEVVAGPSGDPAYASSASPSPAPRRKSAGRR